MVTQQSLPNQSKIQQSAQTSPKNGKERWISLSFPRSGATWVRYFVLTVSGRKLTKFHSDLGSWFPKMHNLSWEESSHFHGLVFCLRNYKQCVPRHYWRFPEKDYNSELVFSMDFEYSYVRTLQMYHDWGGPKHLIRYENLVKYPYGELGSLGVKMGLDTLEIAKFFQNIDRHEKRSKDQYVDKNHLTGKDHSNMLSDLQKEQWDNKLRNQYPELWPYLEEYAE